MTGFDLTDEPWVQVHLLDGSSAELSLRDIFAQASRIRGVTGELPTTAFAVLRLLLAILHRSVEGPRSTEEWGDLWRRDDLPVERISAYLDAVRDRFDLLSPTTPFFQVADLATAKGDVGGLAALIADVPNNIRLFPNRHGAALHRIGYAESARWVVHAQAFEPSGIRGAAVGDPRARGGKVYPIGTGWAGAIGGVHVDGTSLRETLLLNLGPVAPDDLPVWERPPQTAHEEVSGGRSPSGRVDAYTWQKARIRLTECDGAIVGALVTNGDRAVLTNEQNVEPMTAWRRSANQEKATGRAVVYLPACHDPTRQFWRGLTAMLSRHDRSGATRDAAPRLSPGALDWIATLVDDDELESSMPVRLRAVGLEYGPQSATITDVVDDGVSLAVAAVSAQHGDLRHEIDIALDRTGKACWALGVYAANVAAAEVGEAAGDSGTARIAAERAAAESDAYAALDAPFRAWLAALAPSADLDLARAEWLTVVRRTVLRLAGDIAAQAPPQIYASRPPSHPMCVPLADRQLRAYLAKEHILIRQEANDG